MTKTVTRRQALARLASIPIGSALLCSEAEVESAQRAAEASPQDFVPAFFTAHELETVRVLVDLILPADERSASASDVGVPRFLDFIMIDQPERQVAMRGGLAWLDAFSQRRHDRTFVDCPPSLQTAVLDAIAFPERASPELSHGVAFFSAFRDLTATGFFTSKAGFEDLRYEGNALLAEWTGCPPEVLDRLGLSK